MVLNWLAPTSPHQFRLSVRFIAWDPWQSPREHGTDWGFGENTAGSVLLALGEVDNQLPVCGFFHSSLSALYAQ